MHINQASVAAEMALRAARILLYKLTQLGKVIDGNPNTKIGEHGRPFISSGIVTN